MPDQDKLVWGRRVSESFCTKVRTIARELEVNPNYLMAAMAFETGETFSPSILNAAGSGAVGLIQFMPATAQALGTTTEALRRMKAEDQLDFVKKYFENWKGKLKTLEDVYMVILWPSAVGKDNDYILFEKDDPFHPKRYIQNAGLDFNKDGKITKEEAARSVKRMLDKGAESGNIEQ